MTVIDTVTIPARFNGPPQSGNGGYSAGRAAAYLTEPVSVSLRAPPPLDKPMEVRRGGDGTVEFFSGDACVLHAAPSALAVEPPPAPSFSAAEDAMLAFPSVEDHPFPTCFVCGHHRHEGDGLCIYSGKNPESFGVAAVWRPHPAFADDRGVVRPEIVWAAMDCPSGFAMTATENPCLLGRMTASIARLPEVGEPTRIRGWRLSVDGRKQTTASAIYDEDGAVIAKCETLWIQLRSKTPPPAA